MSDSDKMRFCIMCIFCICVWFIWTSTDSFICDCEEEKPQLSVPGLPVHAVHPEVLPPGVEESHLLTDFIFFLLRQVALGNQLVPSLEDITHTALVCCQLHHIGLFKEQGQVVKKRISCV